MMDPTGASKELKASTVSSSTADLFLYNEEKELKDLHWIRDLVVKTRGEFSDLTIGFDAWLQHLTNSESDFTKGNQQESLNALSFAVLVDYEIIAKFSDALMKKEHFEEAVHLQRIVFAGYKGNFGCKYPKTLQSQLKLALYLFNMKEYAQALDLNRKVYKILQSSNFDPNHELTITVQLNVASVFMHQNKSSEARQLLHDVHQRLIHLFGLEHPETVKVKTQLYYCFRLLQKEKEVKEFSEQLYDHIYFTLSSNPEKALSVYETIAAKNASVLGEDHPETFRAESLIANCYNVIKKFKKSSEKFKIVYEKSRKVLGSNHLDTLEAHRCLGHTLVGCHEFAEALRVNKALYPLLEATLGADHKNTLSTLDSIASCLGLLKKFDKALDVLTILHEKQQRTFGSGHKESMDTELHIAVLLAKLGKHRESLDVYQKSYERQVELFGERANGTAQTRRILDTGRRQLALLEKEETLVCSICLVTMEFLSTDAIIMFECTHIFHRNCVRRWARDGKTCPECRSPLHAHAVTSIMNELAESRLT